MELFAMLATDDAEVFSNLHLEGWPAAFVIIALIAAVTAIVLKIID